MASTLTPKQAKFCEQFIVDLNATQAAIRAGYSSKSARFQASALLTNPNISSRIEELRKSQSKRTELTADYVLSGLQEVAERCLQRKPVMEWDYENKCLVQKTDENGEGIWEFDSSGANRAFELLGKHVGVFEKDNKQKRIELPAMTDEQFTKIDQKLEALKAISGQHIQRANG